jgi:hypothetical protein
LGGTLRTEENGIEDERLLAELRSLALRIGPTPPALVAAAKAAFSWRSVATAIAGLEFDSAVDDDDLARVRDGGPERRLRFRCPDHVVELTVAENNRSLAGRVDPPFVGTVVLRHPDGVWLSAAVNQFGQFFFDAVPRGAVSLRPVATDGAFADFETEWVTI